MANGSSGGEIALQEKTATVNGVYTPDEGYDGLGKVTVEVDGARNTLQEFLNMRGTSSYLFGYRTIASNEENGSNFTCPTDEDLETFFSHVQELPGTVASGMFQAVFTITTVPFFDTSRFTHMERMFAYCKNLKSIPHFDTSNVITMEGMFCMENVQNNNDISIPLLNTSKVTTMQRMFINCRGVTSLPHFDTRNVTTMGSMLKNCVSLTSVPQFDTSSVTIMEQLFYGCRSLTTVPLFDTSSVTSMNSMLYGCDSLTTVPQFDTSSVTTMSNMFNNCSALTEIWIKNIKTALQVGSGTSWGHLLTVDSLVHLCYECRDTGSSKTLTVGSANLAKLADVYVKPIEITDEMRAEDDLIDEKLPFVRCESTDEGAILIRDYLPVKNWELK